MAIARREDGTYSLTADRLPGSVWGSNLRAILPTSRWVALSRETARRAGRVCEVCGQPSYYGDGTRNPDCHERWAFDDGRDVQVQRLVGVVALCGACHETQHSGLAELNGRIEAVVQTLVRVNGCTVAEANEDIERSVKRHAQLSGTEWALDLRILSGWLGLDGYSSLVIDSADREALGNTFDKLPRKLSIVTGASIPAEIWNW